MVQDKTQKESEQVTSNAGVLILTLDKDSKAFRMAVDNVTLEEAVGMAEAAYRTLLSAIAERDINQRMEQIRGEDKQEEKPEKKQE